jgi:integrase
MPAPSRTESQESSGPLAVKLGRTTVRIYPRKAERGRSAGFYVASYATGKRRLLWFTDLRDAKAEATRIAALMNAGDAAGASMTGDERRDLLRATEVVAPFQLDVPTAAALFAEAAKLVGVHNVVAACREYARRSPAARERLPLAQAADDYYAAKETKGRSPRLLQDLRSRLGRFVAEHPGKALGEFTTGDVQRWLDRLCCGDGSPVSAQTRRNFATVLGGMFEHYRRRGVLAENPCKDLERDSARRTGDVEFWTPAEAEALLRAAPDVVLPALAVGLFCGLRTEEVARLRWQDVDFEQRHVAVRAGDAKTASRRLVPLPDNAVRWLLPHRGEGAARVYPEHATTLPKRITAVCQAAGVRRVANGCRHSWVTYRVALTGDVARVALEAGNSPTVIHSHYRGLAKEDDAKRFFAIEPQAPDNVVALSRQP